MLSDIEISNQTKLKPITEIAKKIGLNPDETELYGNYKAKINNKAFKRLKNKPDGKLILVTAINPTPAGEGKTTVTIGLGQAINLKGKKAITVIREPSLGPVFGIKGGATGGGYSQALPMDEINLHFTGDMHAITCANNLLCAIIDNHLQQGNTLKIDPRRIFVNRCLDINDRSLRNITIGLGGKTNGIPREDGFIITVASEVMAILCLSENLVDLKERLGNILVAYSFSGNPIYAKDLNVNGAMTVLLKDAINPNLVQSTEHSPIIIHGGPFANIAHGCNSVRATKLAMKLGDYCITEAGFGADLGAEKFLDIKCRFANISPQCIVIVATTRALKYNGGESVKNLKLKNITALKKGIDNLGVHIENMKKYGVPVVVTLNKFENDTTEEIDYIKKYCEEKNCKFSISDSFLKGGKGTSDLAELVIELCEEKSHFSFMYDEKISIKEKILKISKEVYRANEVIYTEEAEKSINEINKLEKNHLPICIAKTPYSLSDDASKLGNPKNFKITVKDVTLSNGAGFIVVLTGKILKMPGLPKEPAAYRIDVDSEGKISGIF